MFYQYDETKRISLFGLILIAVGAIMLLQALGVLDEKFWKYFWPAILILIGARMIIGPFRFGAKKEKKDYIDSEK